MTRREFTTVNIEAAKVARLQAALAEAADELEDWNAWASANDRVTQQARDKTARLIAKYRALAGANLRSEWDAVIAQHGAPVRRRAKP